MKYAVYIMASLQRTLYIGVTGKLDTRVEEHKAHIYPSSFTARYNVTRLVYVELYDEIEEAIAREKQLKAWRRSKKLALIRRNNPEWADLSRPPVPPGPSLRSG